MGCDIHVHVEIKIDNEWHHYNHLSVRRDYSLFGRIAGVRDNNQEPIAPVRGLPDNLSKVTEIDVERWSSDAHTQTWLTSSEVGQLCEELELKHKDTFIPSADVFGFFFNNTYEGWINYHGDRNKQIEDFRFVIWFDN